MKEKIEKLLAEIDILSPISKEEVEELRIKYLSKKGEISTLFNDFRNVANEEKKVVGQLLNDLKNKAQDKINELKETFDNQQNNTNDLDLTFPTSKSNMKS